MNRIKIILSITAVVGLGAFWASSALATTWYVRDGGGTPTQCTGKTNAVYPGSGSGQPCAFNHPAWLIGEPNGSTGLMSGGDTVYIVGDSDINVGQQAQFVVGYGMPNTNGGQCASAYPSACIPSTVPAGTSATNLTSILGIGTHQPQLYGTGGVGYILDLSGGGNYDVENLEITQHDSCSIGATGYNAGYGSFPSYCGSAGQTWPSIGTWAQEGIEMVGTNITTKNLWVHNLAGSAINFNGTVSGWNSTNDRFIAAGQSLTQSESGGMAFTGNNSLTNDVWAFGGCMEKYPLPDPGNFKDLNNYLNCNDANSSGGIGAGGGFVQEGAGNHSCGNWTISYSQFLFNLKDNIDLLHCDGTGTFNFYRSRTEGSNGTALKLNLGTINIEESQVIGNGALWTTAPFNAIKSVYNSSGGSAQLFLCRGNAVANFAGNPNEKVNIINSDITGNCTALLEVGNTGYAAATCGGMSVNVYNSKLIGGYGADINENAVDLYYVGGANGNGTGTVSCNAGQIPLNLYNDSVSNIQDMADCTGANTNSNTNCSQDPQIVSETSGPLTSVLGPNAYYSGTSFGDLLYLQPTSPLRGAGLEGLTYTNGSSNDYNNFPANNPQDIGGVQYNSCIANKNFCSISGECCGGTCSSSGVCGGSTTTQAQPVVSITSPTSGSSFTTGANVTITATASETSGTITNISIYNGATLLGSSSASPYSYVLSNAAAGTYTLTAKATDANGVSVTSSSVTVTVVNASILSYPPVVSITSPSSGSSDAAGSNITITTTASETNGTINNIALYNGSGILLGSSSTTPFNYVYSNILAGTYTFYAVATDVNSVSTTSSSITVTVTGTPTPVIAITSPSNGSTYAKGATLTATVSASESNGTIAIVNFYNNGVLFDTETKSPYSVTWTNGSMTSYTITAVATDANNVSRTSGPVTITMASSGQAPSITSQPSSVTVTGPASATFTVAASGTPAPTYQWMQSVSGGAFSAISGATSASYTTGSTSSANSGTKYECVVTNASGSVTSTAATLTVNLALVAPNVTSQPASVTVTAPASATFTVAASGTPAPTYQWMQSVSGGAFSAISGATSASYTTGSTTSANSGIQYECVVTNASGSVTSSAATLTVNPALVAPNVTSQPASVTVTAPASATFTVAASGTPVPTYQWMQSVSGGAFSAISGATSASYTTGSTSSANSGTKYECVVTNASGSVTSSAATLTVNPALVAPNVTSQPSSVTVTGPTSATFTVAASGTPAPTYQWMQSVSGGAFSAISGATSASYTTGSTTSANSGIQYECVVTNASGSVTSSAATLTVNPALVAPNVTSQPASVTVTAPASATFTVAASGTPVPTYQWMQSVSGGAFSAISGATSASYTTGSTSSANSGIQYECVVTNVSGSVTSSAATLTVNPALVAPNVTSQPASVTVTAPASATFTVAANGTPVPTYQWMQSVSGGAFSAISGATSASYTTGSTSSANSGIQYECVVTNASGSVTSTAATLTVNPAIVLLAPIIAVQPVSMIVTDPDTATFSVVAIGSPTLTYQWMKIVNGRVSQINGANSSSYTTGPTTTSTGTQYECVVTNAIGSVTSFAATLTVDPPVSRGRR